MIDISNNTLRQSAALASLCAASVLLVAKLVAYVLGDSVAVLAALADSTMDVMASTITLLGVMKAQKPADAHHRYGHGKAEPLAALAQAAFVAGSAALLMYEASQRLFNPIMPTHVPLAMGVMCLSLAVTWLLVAYQRYVVRRTGSLAIRADRLHYIGDAYLNVGVLLSLVVTSQTGVAWVDPVLAMGVAVFMLVSARRIVASAIDVLMDREMPEHDRQNIVQLVRADARVKGVHDLRTRHDGQRAFIEMHIELDPHLSLTMAHDIADDAEQRLLRAYPGAAVLLHQEPAGLDDVRLDHQLSYSERPPRQGR
ncbi:MAG: cation transporter [Alphaproteobacteria bacterium]|nr:cation transporter [Alphaproteobacteria bacterium]NDC56598.1 cation transporter [Alphaproteobacteria bacterium]NDG04825.1 cation transporter [Alphaproteobacteria bacterium]